mmetsp:Transcript_1033/g.3099  ORF Transcript_1033/g.3099 Transcript_1033/m.3099 type:complete len:398 (-) Transcript_1033:50-1243(-)
MAFCSVKLEPLLARGALESLLGASVSRRRKRRPSRRGEVAKSRLDSTFFDALRSRVELWPPHSARATRRGRRRRDVALARLNGTRRAMVETIEKRLDALAVDGAPVRGGDAPAAHDAATVGEDAAPSREVASAQPEPADEAPGRPWWMGDEAPSDEGPSVPLSHLVLRKKQDAAYPAPRDPSSDSAFELEDSETAAFKEEFGFYGETPTDDEIERMSVKKLKRYITHYNQSLDGLLEKRDLRDHAREIRNGFIESGFERYWKDRKRVHNGNKLLEDLGMKAIDPSNPLGDYCVKPAPIAGSQFENILAPAFEDLWTKDDAWLKAYVLAARDQIKGASEKCRPPIELEGAEHDALVEEATICKIAAHALWDMCYYMMLHGKPDPQSQGIASQLPTHHP